MNKSFKSRTFSSKLEVAYLVTTVYLVTTCRALPIQCLLLNKYPINAEKSRVLRKSGYVLSKFEAVEWVLDEGGCEGVKCENSWV